LGRWSPPACPPAGRSPSAESPKSACARSLRRRARTAGRCPAGEPPFHHEATKVTTGIRCRPPGLCHGLRASPVLCSIEPSGCTGFETSDGPHVQRDSAVTLSIHAEPRWGRCGHPGDERPPQVQVGGWGYLTSLCVPSPSKMSDGPHVQRGCRRDGSMRAPHLARCPGRGSNTKTRNSKVSYSA
jgi:hypothetical protein